MAAAINFAATRQGDMATLQEIRTKVNSNMNVIIHRNAVLVWNKKNKKIKVIVHRNCAHARKEVGDFGGIWRTLMLGTLFDPCRLAYLAYTSND